MNIALLLSCWLYAYDAYVPTLSIRLIAVDAAEAAKRRREEARNGLEAYLYRLRDLLEDGDESSPFEICSTEDERKAIGKKVHETLHWMSDEADHARLVDMLDKKDALE